MLAEAHAEPQPADWIVRACQDRTLHRGAEAEAPASLWAAAAPVRLTKTIAVRGRKSKLNCEDRGRRQPQQSRTANVEVRATSVTLHPPWRPDRQLPAVTVHAVLFREIAPPAGEPAIEWLLLTSLPIDTIEQTCQIVEYSCTRWMVEVFFRTLKSGCRVEQRRFESLDRLLSCLAVYLIVAWRGVAYTLRLPAGAWLPGDRL